MGWYLRSYRPSKVIGCRRVGSLAFPPVSVNPSVCVGKQGISSKALGISSGTTLVFLEGAIWTFVTSGWENHPSTPVLLPDPIPALPSKCFLLPSASVSPSAGWK